MRRRGRSVPAPLEDTLRVMELLLLTQRPLSLPQIAYLRQVLYCFPELHDPVARYLKQRGEPRVIDKILDDAILTALDGTARIELSLEEAALSIGSDTSITNIMSLIADHPEEWPVGDRLYLAASVRGLRRKMMTSLSAADQSDHRTQAAQFEILRRYFTPRLQSTKGNKEIAQMRVTLDQIVIQRRGITGISCLESQYAEVNQKKQSFFAIQHPSGQYFVCGPHKKLSSGKYMLEMGFFCQKQSVVDVEVYDSGFGRVVKTFFADLSAGQSYVRCAFDWNSETMNTFENRVRVLKPQFGNVELVSYFLTP